MAVVVSLVCLLAAHAATQVDHLDDMSLSDTQELLKQWHLHKQFSDAVGACFQYSNILDYLQHMNLTWCNSLKSTTSMGLRCL